MKTTDTYQHKYPLMGTHFVLDEEKILREGKYSLESIYQKIDEVAAECNLIKIDKNTYHCRGTKYDLSDMGSFVFVYMEENDWFLNNIKEWEWLSENEGNTNLLDDEFELRRT